MVRTRGPRWLWIGLGLVVCAAAVIWACLGFAAARGASEDLSMKQLQVAALQAQLAAAKARTGKSSASPSKQASVPQTAAEPELIDLLSTTAAAHHVTLSQASLTEDNARHVVHVAMQGSATSLTDAEGFLYGLQYGTRELNPTSLQAGVQNSTWTVSVEWDAPYGP